MGSGIPGTPERAFLLDNGKVLLTGAGFDGWLYDARVNRWSATGPRLFSRPGRSSATRLRDGRVLVAGGSFTASFEGSFFYYTVGAAEIYDPVGNAWTGAGSMLSARRFARSVLLADGRVLVAGGDYIYFFILDPIVRAVHDAEVFDPRSGTWSAVPNPADRRYESLSLLLKDGRVLGSPESWTPATDTWTATGTAIAGVRSLLNDGRVLVIGYSVAGVFDPGANAWTTLAPGAAPRSGHTVSQLPGGALLVLGGLGTAAAGDPALAAREVELFWR